MSRVIQHASGEPDERFHDGLAIGTLAIAKPAKPDQFADRSRPDHHYTTIAPRRRRSRLRRCRSASGRLAAMSVSR
jgi:hypothetical protein